ncbi:MAG TPA: hypothetical protein VK881_14485 [bacterium]|nr:hypothetical protein [bacterium]
MQVMVVGSQLPEQQSALVAHIVKAPPQSVQVVPLQVWPGAQQTLLQQAWVVGQQMVPQSAVPAGHAVVQVVPTQVWPGAQQTLLQQAWVVGQQVVPQGVDPDGHEHFPLVQTWPTARLHLMPQAPQLAGSLNKSVQTPTPELVQQVLRGDAQQMVLFAQTWLAEQQPVGVQIGVLPVQQVVLPPVVQTWPAQHFPFTQLAVAQQVVPPQQVELPVQQVTLGPLPQTAPEHVQIPFTQLKPLGQPQVGPQTDPSAGDGHVQVPFTQVWPPVHAWPQVPQLLGLFDVLTQVVPQQVSVGDAQQVVPLHGGWLVVLHKHCFLGGAPQN